MKGLELSAQYWRQVALPEMEKTCPRLMEHAAFGLVGEGSECFGFDDEISRDHDWGPGFCIWICNEDMSPWAQTAEALYQRLPKEFEGFRRLRVSTMTQGRVGVHRTDQFYRNFLGIDRPPETDWEWFILPEYGLATATNGRVFHDGPGRFTAFRQKLLAGYPEDVRKKKLAAHCALAAQAGQYNYARCLKRGDTVAALQALSQFVDHLQAIVFLLNNTYRPYYKWAHRAMQTLPLLGAELTQPLEALSVRPAQQESAIEEISALVIQVLRQQGYSRERSDFLLTHGEAIQASIQNPRLRNLHLMTE